ncbi:MAG: NAD(P)-dependent oxidoreductase [Nanoarchaeota archaeon]
MASIRNLRLNTKDPKVLIGPSSFGVINLSPLRQLIHAGFTIVDNPYKRRINKDELLDLLPGVIGLIAGLETLDKEVLGKSDLRIISRCGSGLSNIDLEAAHNLGIIVRNTPLAPVTAVAELVVGCLFSLLRQVPQMDIALHNKKWDKRIGRQLFDMEVAVIGLGNIGKKVAKLLSLFGAKVMGVDPLLSGLVDNVPIVSLNEAIKHADIITLHCSGENCLLGAREFGLMKQGIYLLNAARGSLIDEKALKNALDSYQVAGAWLDTFTDEPYKGILCDCPQVILTPHVGSYTKECRMTMEMQAANNLIEAFENLKGK